MNPFALEGNPSDEQKSRLEDWLVELKFICRNYQLLLDTDEGDVRIVDLLSNTTIGIGLTSLLNDDGLITDYDCTGSILDGVWLVEGPAGLVEQRSIAPVWTRRPVEEQPQ